MLTAAIRGTEGWSGGNVLGALILLALFVAVVALAIRVTLRR